MLSKSCSTQAAISLQQTYAGGDYLGDHKAPSSPESSGGSGDAEMELLASQLLLQVNDQR